MFGSSTHAPTLPSIPSRTPAPLHIRRDPHSGRKYHASAPLAEETDLLGICYPYSYTIWKRFRNEVCAECWRYDGGRRTFLTRRDDEGLNRMQASGQRPQDNKSSTSAGLWFCDERCQTSWIAREGVEAVDLLRQLEAARQKKSKPKHKPKLKSDAEEQETVVDVTPELIERVWDVVQEKERSPKELRKWRDLQLEDYEADMARYVLLALHRYHREECSRSDGPRPLGEVPEPTKTHQTETYVDASSSEHEDLEWRTFASLQSNELQLLKACPEILEHQTRIYQLLKGRFGSRAEASSVATSRSSSVPAPSPQGAHSHGDNASVRENAQTGESRGASYDEALSSGQCDERGLSDLVTVANVRTILGIDPGNSFGVWEMPLVEESECLGFAVYPLASFFNHHCAPNVRKERNGRTLRFLTMRAVDAGEELCISYGHVEDMDLKARQKELLEGWYFECRCSRCTVEAEHG
ncbi:hypothetical protein BD414DRAFT_477685 [Trametes punicea]|nr:hypothetical protein BD414DRAFT_477685 [Trametes punicea]